MANKNILIEREMIKKREGVVILDLEKYLDIKKKMEEYERKKKLMSSLEKFGELAKWGRSFAKKKKITLKKVLEDD